MISQTRNPIQRVILTNQYQHQVGNFFIEYISNDDVNFYLKSVENQAIKKSDDFNVSKPIVGEKRPFQSATNENGHTTKIQKLDDKNGQKNQSPKKSTSADINEEDDDLDNLEDIDLDNLDVDEFDLDEFDID